MNFPSSTRGANVQRRQVHGKRFAGLWRANRRAALAAKNLTRG
jgi:hypothetical protein